MKKWIFLPSGDLSDRINWKSIGDDRYAVLRSRLLLVWSKGEEYRFGPVISSHNVVPEDTITIRRKRELVITQNTSITESVRFAVNTRICEQLSSKIAAELSAKAPGFSGKISSELLAKEEYEVKETLEDALSKTTFFQIKEMEETEHIIELKGGKAPRVAKLHRVFWPHYLDIYLHSVEYLELEYRKAFLFWRQIRDTIKKPKPVLLRWPLARLMFYAPQSEPDILYVPVKNVLQDSETIEVGVNRGRVLIY